VRFNAMSSTTGTNGSVYADVDVPDLTRPAVALSGIVLSTGAPAVPTTTMDRIEPITPVVPTSVRAFSRADQVTGFVRIFQGGSSLPEAVDVVVSVVGADDREASRTSDTIAADAFRPARSADYTFKL